jgi:hypothetical protein
MPNEKVVLLLQTKVLPQYRAEILQAARANKLPTRAEPGVEAYYQTARKGPSLHLKASLRKSLSTQTCSSLISEPILRKENIHELKLF